jgi:hypothetical protein
LNAHLEACCRRRLSDRLRGHAETIGERLELDLAALRKADQAGPEFEQEERCRFVSDPFTNASPLFSRCVISDEKSSGQGRAGACVPWEPRRQPPRLW